MLCAYQQNVPVGPPASESVQVTYYVVYVRLATSPPLVAVLRTAAVTRLRRHDRLVRPAVVYLAHVVEAVAAVPVYGDAPHQLACEWVGIEDARPVERMIFVVIEEQKQELRVRGVQLRVQVVDEEGQLLLGRVRARLPDALVLRLVLYRQTCTRRPKTSHTVR